MATEAMSWKSKAESALARARAAAGKHDRVIESTVRTGLTFAAAFGVSFYNTKATTAKGHAPELLGMPVPLVLGLGCKALSFTGAGAKHADHLDAIGDGALAAYGAALGAAAGAKPKK